MKARMKVTKNIEDESPGSEDESPVSNTLTVGTKFQSLAELKNALDHALLKGEVLPVLCKRYSSRTLQQAKLSCPKLMRAVSEELKYTFVTYSCIHGWGCFKSRPKTGIRPQQM